MNALEVEGVWKYYGDFPALRNVGLQVTPGSTVALLGRNGAGKTTLLRIIAGLGKASKGSVRILGQDVRDENARRRIGVLGHGISLYDELSATENLVLFAKLYGMDDPRKTAHAWLERTGLERVSDVGLVREFSRGMRQRLAVALGVSPRKEPRPATLRRCRSPRSTTVRSLYCRACFPKRTPRGGRL